MYRYTSRSSSRTASLARQGPKGDEAKPPKVRKILGAVRTVQQVHINLGNLGGLEILEIARHLNSAAEELRQARLKALVPPVAHHGPAKTSHWEHVNFTLFRAAVIGGLLGIIIVLLTLVQWSAAKTPPTLNSVVLSWSASIETTTAGKHIVMNAAATFDGYC